MVQTYFSEKYAHTILIFLGITASVCAYILFTAIQAWRKGVPYSGYWLLVYLPYLLSIAIVLAESAGQISLPWLPFNTPMFAAMTEAVAMMFCLNAYSRESHAQAVREQAAAQRDPLTGFLNEARFMAWASSAWQRAQHSLRDISMVYVLVESKGSALDTVQAEAMMVRTAVRETDGVGRIGHNMLGIAMPGVPEGDALNARLSRLIALGLMLDQHDASAQR